jgi:hypothetical protein
MKTNYKRFISVITILALLAVLIPMNVTEASSQLELNKTKAKICVNQVVKLKVTNSSSKVTWKSSNTKIATVSKSGKVTGKKVGTCTITAKVGKKSVKCKVTVAKHNWIKVDETGHYEQVKTGTRKYIEDHAGHGPFYTDDEWHEHEATGCIAGYGIYNEPVYETQWVETSPAWDETITTGYICSICGATQ